MTAKLSRKTPLINLFKGQWATLSGPKQKIFMVLGVFIVVLLIWYVLLSPAIKTIQKVKLEKDGVAAQLAQMQGLRTKALGLKKEKLMTSQEALSALKEVTRSELGSAGQVDEVSNSSVDVVLNGASPTQLANWMASARTNANAIPSSAQMMQKGGADLKWSGHITFQLPAAP